jgi:hypothetical protein
MHAMTITKNEPQVAFRPTKMQAYDGWYVQVVIAGLPPLQLGGFKTEDEAKEWIAQKSHAWLEDHRSQYI